MCGRYYVDDETAREIEKLVRQVGEKLRRERGKRDVYPTQSSMVLLSNGNNLEMGQQVWGFPGFQKKNASRSSTGVIFNARSESALEKKTFRDSMLHRRCIIPAKGFYEWDRDKNKVAFQREDGKTLFFAGFYKEFEGVKRFVILTTNANASMSDVHDRMPLILDKGEIEDWLWREEEVGVMLKRIPMMLVKIGDYQQSFF